MKTKSRSTTIHHRKRSGLHQKRSKKFHRVYLPYLPLVAAIIASVVLSGWSPKGQTLAYATNTNISGLLQSTNTQRNANGQVSLTLNGQLNSAAQAKANDMVARNYWSHNTPEGQEPWIFVSNAGYNYTKAGENLAYGFTDSAGTITGWMNSPTHKANMLDGTFTEVGFGFANSANYTSSGQQTVVVAMYGKPQTLAASTPAAAPTATPAPASATPAPSSTPAQAIPADTPASLASPSAAETPTPAASAEAAKPTAAQPFTTDTAGLEPVAQPVARVDAISKGKAPWALFAVTVLLGLAIAALLLKQGLAFRRLLRDSENFVLHHPLFDSTVLGLIILGVTLSQTVGFIK